MGIRTATNITMPYVFLLGEDGKNTVDKVFVALYHYMILVIANLCLTRKVRKREG